MLNRSTLTVAEIFSSIQGETTLAGIPTAFIRCAGCNLDCTYCDSQYARQGGEALSLTEICTQVESFSLPAACITGGEPLLQPGTINLAHRLMKRGYRVSVETNGSQPTGVLPEGVTAIIDVKCPGSGASESFRTENVNTSRPGDQFKFVLTGREDFDYACAFIETHGLRGNRTLLFSPVTSKLPPAQLADWILHECPSARLNLQLHRYIWPDETRGR